MLHIYIYRENPYVFADMHLYIISSPLSIYMFCHSTKTNNDFHKRYLLIT